MTPLHRHWRHRGRYDAAASERAVFSGVVVDAVAVGGEAQFAAPQLAGGYFVVVAVDGEATLVTGDFRSDAYRRAAARSAPRGEALLISRQEHVAMRRDVRSTVRSYATSALEETSARTGGRQQRKKKKKRKRKRKGKEMVQNSPK
uniref:Uncharacterized protein n=1 Tax=Ananas comosus var. bracteatus TaxID=296719 RepID=A0A6V7QMQ8_ANACO|nr:unnamed protein product [Ananas comosus var. bracteatus]